MERIYFDKQIYSHLFKGDKEVYRTFLELIKSNKNKFLFCYSHAHILDLKNDKTNIKYKELEFMETIVGDNYLSYHALEKRTSCYLAKPIQVFEDEEENDDPISFSTMFDDLDTDSLTPEQKKQLDQAKDLFTNQKFDFGFNQLLDSPDDLSKTLGKILPIGVPSMTLMEWTERFMGLLKTLEEDKSVYKGLRGTVDKYLNNGKFTIDFDSIDFNDDLKNSELRKSFIEHVTDTINPDGKKEITNYDFFTNAYLNLDLLGISKEPARKVMFRNVLNDGIHAYYGAFCNYVISDDQGFLKKTKALYRLLRIDTKVFHIDEFIKYFHLMTKSFEKDTQSFFDLVINDLTNGLVVNSKTSLKFNRLTTEIKPYHNYLGYFNRLEHISEEGQHYVLLSRLTHNYSNFKFYREYEGLVNNSIELFGDDFEFQGTFDWQTEVQLINEKKWKGRFWDFGTLTVLLEINEGINEICLLITLKKKDDVRR